MNARSLSAAGNGSTVIRGLAKVNALSFLSQVVQIGTVPALMALRVNATTQSSLAIGIVAAAPWIAILLVGRWTPALLKRYGLVTTNWLAILLSVLALSGSLLATQPGWLFALNFLLGIGLILRWVACDTWIIHLAPESIRGRAIGTHETLMGCGIATGSLLIGAIGSAGSLPFLSCICLLIVAGLILSTLPESNAFPGVETAAYRTTTLRTYIAPLAAGFLAGFVETSSISFLPVFADRNVFALHITAVLAGFGVGGTVLQMPLGWLADRFGYRRTQLATALIIAAGCMLLPLAVQRPVLLFALLFFWGGAAGGMNTLAVIEAGHLATHGNTSTVMMAIALAYTLGSVTGPVFAGYMTALLPTMGFALTMGAATLIYMTVWTFTRSLAARPPL